MQKQLCDSRLPAQRLPDVYNCKAAPVTVSATSDVGRTSCLTAMKVEQSLFTCQKLHRQVST
jgi:hypothetical protein